MKEKLNILLLGNGGREAAIAWKISQSPRTERLFVAPGNAAPYGENVALDPMDFEAVKQFVADNAVDLVVVGPEQPLVAGIADALEETGVPVVGPSQRGAQLEGSKEFAKEFMARHGIPTARFMTVTHETLDEGFRFMESLKPPYVLKADGLAGGKGVLIIDNLPEAKDSLEEMIRGMFGDSSKTVVIEEYLSGIECSVFVVTDGNNYKILPVAKDYKRVGEGDTGLNTGGMGAVSPVPFADEQFMAHVEDLIVKPTLRGLAAEELPYRGFIFLGLMNVGGNPMVIEYNVRMGDPETEVVMPRIKSDLVDLLEGVVEGTLDQKTLETDPRAASTVMLVSGGYPGKFEKGKKITGTDALPEGCIPFFAGAVRNADGDIVTSGGRVLALTCYGPDIHTAADTAKAAARTVHFDGKYFRNDIANDL